jgi:hypothetical protein
VGDVLGVEVSRGDEPVVWALVGCAAGLLDQRPPDRVRVVLDGEPRAVDDADGRVLVLPFSYLVGMSCGDLRIAITRELGQIEAGGPLSGWVGRATGRVGRALVGLERRRSVLRRPARPVARAFFGATRRVAQRRARASAAIAERIYGREAVAEAADRAELVRMGFEWFWRVEVMPFVERGWRPPVAAGFDSFVDAPAVRRRLPGIGGDGPIGEILGGTDELEAALIGRESLVGVGWQDGAGRLAVSVWDGHVRGRAPARRGGRVADLGQVVRASVDALGDDRRRLQTELAALGSALALALVGDGWRVVKLPGRPAGLERDGVVLDPHAEILALLGERGDGGRWAARCRALGIGDLRLALDGTDEVGERQGWAAAGVA